jgi:hypothetical protein
MTYTYEGEPEKRRAGLGVKVLIFGFSIFAVLGAFWTVVWFIRSYVEQPRIAVRAPMSLASHESEPAPAPPLREPTAREPIAAAATVPAPAPAADDPPPQSTASIQLAGPAPSPAPAAAAPSPAPAAATPAPAAAAPASDPAPSGPINDRWFPTTSTQWPDQQNNAVAPAAPPAAEPPAPVAVAPEPAVDEVVASMEPAITGVVPKPRPKPPAHSASARLREPPLPRPRPDGSAPQSVWTAVPVSDDRFPAASQ